ncbi:MAG: hypothetical protein HFH64_08850 [Lachnospiraceae bacterium]|nr:hypothetical protein [Lachnospiraceae bacterium]
MERDVIFLYLIAGMSFVFALFNGVLLAMMGYDFYNLHHKAIVKMMQMVMKNAHKYGKWVGICGELGADSELTEEFLRIGVDELSVAPSMILKVRKKIREIK